MSDTQIKVDTGLLREYAGRLKKVNSRLKALEGALEALYRREGLVDIGAVLRSGDIGWSKTIDDAATYLLETAEDFENVEKEICDLVDRCMQGEHPFAYFDDGEQPWTIAGGLSQIEGNVLQPGEYGADTTGSQSQAESSESLGVWESILNPYNDHANPVIKTMQQINDAVMKYNPSTLAADWLIVQPMKAIKSLYLNGLAAGVQAIEGKEITFTPDMTYAQYTAKVAAATGSPDYYKLARDYFAGDSYKQALSQVLNVSPDSALVGNLSIGAVTLLSTMAEGAADPTSYIGIGEAVALARGGQALKIGDAGYNVARQSDKVKGGLEPLGEDGAIAEVGEDAGTVIKGSTSSLGVDEMLVSDTRFLNSDGDIDWGKYAPNGGYIPGTKTSGLTIDIGTVIDRYGNQYGRYTSPVGVPYKQRALPYIENPNAYHRYEVLKPIDNVTMGKIAEAFDQVGGGIQYELPASIKQLIKDGYLKEIK